MSTDRLRIPRQCQSTAGKSGSKAKPRGVVDDQLVNIPVLPLRAKWRRRSESSTPRRNRAFNDVCIFSVGKSALNAEIRKYKEASAELSERKQTSKKIR
jgi:hypothetical protein